MLYWRAVARISSRSAVPPFHAMGMARAATGLEAVLHLERGHRFVRFSYSGRAADIAEAGRRLAAWVEARA